MVTLGTRVVDRWLDADTCDCHCETTERMGSAMHLFVSPAMADVPLRAHAYDYAPCICRVMAMPSTCALIVHMYIDVLLMLGARHSMR